MSHSPLPHSALPEGSWGRHAAASPTACSFVDVQEMRECVSALEHARRSLTEVLESMTSQVHDQREGWDPRVQDAYDAAQAQWDASCTRMRAIINRLGMAANEAGRQRL